MVYYFKAKDGTIIYMGKDKYENEELIKYGWPEDIWFHVQNLSSAHVYIRMPVGSTMDDLSEEAIRECSQLVKENSIEGCKKESVTVIYTPWSNLRKDGSMAPGQVSHYNDKLIRRYVVLERDRVTLRRLMSTKEERYPDLAQEREMRDKEEREQRKAKLRIEQKEKKAIEAQWKKEKQERSYDSLFANLDEETKKQDEARRQAMQRKLEQAQKQQAASTNNDLDFLDVGEGDGEFVDEYEEMRAQEEDFM